MKKLPSLPTKKSFSLISWAVLSDEQMSKRWRFFSLLNNEQMSKRWLGVEFTNQISCHEKNNLKKNLRKACWVDGNKKNRQCIWSTLLECVDITEGSPGTLC